MENLNINSNERDFNSLVKQLVHLLPILSVAIIGLGIIKQILYYFYFLVPIKYFLGLSELGLIISDDLIVVVLIFFTCTIFTFVLSKEKKNSKHAKENKFENIDFKSLEKLKKEYKILNISIKSVSSLLFIAAIFYFCLSPNYIRGLYVSRCCERSRGSSAL